MGAAESEFSGQHPRFQTVGIFLEARLPTARLVGSQSMENGRPGLHPPMLRGEGVVITRDVGSESVVRAMAEGVVIEQASVRSSTERNCAVAGDLHGRPLQKEEQRHESNIHSRFACAAPQCASALTVRVGKR